MVCRHSVLQTDDYADDLSLVLRVGEGIVLLCGCCHAGLRNTLATVRAQYDAPLLAVVGGTHLVQADSAELGAIIAALQAEGAPALYLNHCTGERALYTLRQALGERVHSCPAGTVISFP
jgi:7,8-dihydropterin-6-yl-methyl-4-(beta-D-ribofuranosyl)aminobenzene 5'-phosphate synthase